MKSIKDKIRQHLAKVTEATAKKIGAAIGMKDYPSDVVKALSEMRTDAEVECEKRKGQGNEYWYWLTNVTAETCVQESGENETQASLTATDETQMPVIKQPRYNPDTVGFDAEKRAIAIAVRNHNLIDEICTAVGYSNDEPLEQLSAYIVSKIGSDAGGEVAELRKQIADLHAESAGFCSVIEDQSARIKYFEDERAYREGVIADLNAKLGYARIQIDALNEQLMHGEEAVDVKDAARGYLVCAPKRKPAKLMKAESAVARAKSAAKATGRCEVFALVPVGIATRKQIQAVEFKERAA